VKRYNLYKLAFSQNDLQEFMMVLSYPSAAPAPDLPKLFRPITLGVIVGNRGFFPKHLISKARPVIVEALARQGIKAIIVDENDTAYGGIESLQEAHTCADLFRQHADEIDGILVTLPNFGDERAVANTLRFANLNVPVLIHAFPDEVGIMTVADRRDSFCGKMSVCNNLRQYGIPYTLTTNHTVDPDSDMFARDLARFAAVCRVVRGLRRSRIGALGARPQAFNTVRYSEKLLERAGVSVETLDLSEAFGRVNTLAESDERVAIKLCAHAKRSRRVAHANGKAGCGHRPMDDRQRPRCDGDSMLDGDGGVLRRCTVYTDEHRQQYAPALGM
jgi:L-fucose isomerase-like protein